MAKEIKYGAEAKNSSGWKERFLWQKKLNLAKMPEKVY